MRDEPFVFCAMAVSILLLPIALLFGADETTVFVLLYGLGFYACLGGAKSASVAQRLERQLEDFVEESDK